MNRHLVLSLLVLLAGCELDGIDTSTDEASLDGGGDAEVAAGANECAPVQALSCGAVVHGDTSDWDSGATSELDAYPIAVGNYDAPEIVYSFVAQTGGEVTFSLIDPTPTELDQDLFVLEGGDGCRAAGAIERGFNAVTFEATAGATYYLVVDGFAGDAGAFAAQLECDGAVPTPDPATYGECTFGTTTRDLQDADHLTRSEVGNYRALSEVPSLVLEQMWAGVQSEDWGWFDEPVELFEAIDDDGVYETDLRDLVTGADYTWLRWYMGDTEVGYVFAAGGLEPIAKVGDGDIYDCAE